MQVYSYSEARQNLARVLDQAERSGRVLIRRRDGRAFALTPEEKAISALDMPAIDADASAQEILDIVQEGRDR